jgi:hypothetical protein
MQGRQSDDTERDDDHRRLDEDLLLGRECSGLRGGKDAGMRHPSELLAITSRQRHSGLAVSHGRWKTRLDRARIRLTLG